VWALASLARLVVQAATTRVPVRSPALASIFETPILQAVVNAKMGWVTLALAVTLASVMFSIRLASGRT
jgi:hypothetical protein